MVVKGMLDIACPVHFSRVMHRFSGLDSAVQEPKISTAIRA
jgi:hypothetical protein